MFTMTASYAFLNSGYNVDCECVESIIKDSSCPAIMENNRIVLRYDENNDDGICSWQRVDVQSLGFTSINEVEAAFNSFIEDEHFTIKSLSLTRVDIQLNTRAYPSLTFEDWSELVNSKLIQR